VTPRERWLKTVKREIPDRVPCAPDISIMVPIKLQKKPFWDFYINTKDGSPIDENYINEKISKAYIDACNYFGVAAWLWHVKCNIEDDRVKYEYKIIEKKSDRIVTKTTMHTPEGDIWSETLYTINNPPFVISKYIKNFNEDFRFIKYFYPPLENIDFEPIILSKKYMGETGVNSIGILPPSLVHLDLFVEGGLGKLGLIYYDYPELIAQYKDIHEEWSIKYLKKIIDAGCCDEIETGGSGLMTWQSPKITKELSLAGIKMITQMCKGNDLISHLHCCGFEKELVRMCAEETDLDIIEPLEIQPQGDCILKEIKQKYGKKLVLKGNLHTSKVMLADVKTVEAAAIKCIEGASRDGGFILSTGDQCGRDTPHENIFKMVEVCKKYGRY